MTAPWVASALAILAAAFGPQAMASGSPKAAVVDSGAEIASSPGPIVDPDGGNVVAVVPGESIESSDGITQDIRRGSLYRAIFQVWVAPNERRAKARVMAVGAKVHGCSSTSLQPGIDNYLSCEVRSTGDASRSVTLTIVANTDDGSDVSRSFTHTVRR